MFCVSFFCLQAAAKIGSLKNLESLRFALTELESLPDEISQLENLKEFPVSIGNLERLTYINVYDNFGLDEGYRTYLRPSVKEDG